MEDFIKIKTQCVRKNELWRDPDFPAESLSLFYHQVPDIKFEWTRPREIYRDPNFIDPTYDGFDVDHGTLGDHWLVGCMETLHLCEGIFNHVVPADQEFRLNYAGIFRFRIWWCGKWEEVLVDDRLPTVEGKLVFIQNTHAMQLWAALLEKAYAKLHGSYEALKYGNTQDGLADFTGGIVERRLMPKANEISILHDLLRSTSTIAVTVATAVLGPLSTVLDSKSFRIYEIDKVLGSRGSIYLIRLVKPLRPGEKPFNKFISEKYSTIWSSISMSKKEKIMTTNSGFWIPFEEFAKAISYIRLIHFGDECCSLEPTLTHKKKWNVKCYHGRWMKGVSAGGCINNTDTFYLNPQIQIEINDSGPVVIALSQNNILEPKVIGFSVYKLEQPLQEKASAGLFREAKRLLDSQYSNARHVSQRSNFGFGSYLLVPTTYESRKEGRFTVRIFSLQPVKFTALDSLTRLLKPIMFTAKPGEDSGIFKPYHLLFLHLADEHKTIDAFDLQELLEKSLPNDYVQSCATIETCRQIVLAMEVPGEKDVLGRITVNDYKNLLANLKRWEEIFRLHSTERRGVLVVERFHAALRDVGFVVDDRAMVLLVFKYMRRDCTLRFGDFVSAIFHLHRAFCAAERQQAKVSTVALVTASTYAKDVSDFILALA